MSEREVQWGVVREEVLEELWVGLVADRKWKVGGGLAGVCVAREDDIDTDVQALDIGARVAA